MRVFVFVALAALGISLGACEKQPENSAMNKVFDAQKAFERADDNKDGVVSRGEAGVVANLDFQTADTDHNAALTPEEFEVAFLDAAPRG
jgi:Ca2+-binding EF-hand superfamily protein